MTMNRKRFRSINAAVTGTAWAILPQKLAEIQRVLDERASGIELTAGAIASRIGPSRKPTPSTSKIAIINVFGTIAPRLSAMEQSSGGISVEAISAAFSEAVRNPEITAIVLNIDSPGGAVGGIAELSQQIFDARGKKPIIAVANGQMASAALWIGSAADEVVAVPSATDVGSYGVLMIHRDNTKALEKAGIKQTIVGSTEFKGEGWGPMTDDFQAHIKEKVDKISAQFGEALARNYGITTDAVDANFGKGRTFLAEEALAAGLVHRISTLDTVLADLHSGARPRSSGTASAANFRSSSVMNFECFCRSHGRDASSLDVCQTGMMRGLFDGIRTGSVNDFASIPSLIDAAMGRDQATQPPVVVETAQQFAAKMKRLDRMQNDVILLAQEALATAPSSKHESIRSSADDILMSLRREYGISTMIDDGRRLEYWPELPGDGITV